MNLRRPVLLAFFLFAFTLLRAQHKHDSAMMHMEGMDMSGMDMGGMDMPMSHALSLNLPMNRDGSGTSWLPDASPMYGYMLHSKSWMVMFHGDIFPRYTQADIFKQGSRGAAKWDAPDMLMAMAQRKIGQHGLLHLNLMLSADALIAGGSGYPLLFQTGETWRGQALVDRQHPHDLFSELSVSYAYALSEKADVFGYLGYPGEPALGPVAFMHRPSAMFMPDAPISHHWSDATHISFGVATFGVRLGRFRLEGSSFTGREPDEDRFNFDKPRFDSWSSRLSFNPDDHWALQVSQGFIKSPESTHPGEDIVRTTASATWVNSFSKKSYVAATLLWGQNKIKEQDASNSLLAEATWKYSRLALYMRYEWVQKSVEELSLDPLLYQGEKNSFPINAVTAGFGYDLFSVSAITVAAGAQLSAYPTPAALQSLYGNTPLSGEVFLHLYPRRM